VGSPDISILFSEKKPAWTAWFGIAIFPPGSPLRWAKVHLFKWKGGSGYPLAALEGFEDRTEAMLAVGWTDRVEYFKAFVPGGDLRVTGSQITFGDIFQLNKTDARTCRMAVRVPGEDARAVFTFEPGWPVRWAQGGPVISYTGFHSRVSVVLNVEGEEFQLDGFGVLERVSGTKLPFDFLSILPGSFHWDVVVFEDDTLDSSAGLYLGTGGRSLLGFKGRAKLPGGKPVPMRRGIVKYIEMREEPLPGGDSVAFPLVWCSDMRAPHQRLTYTATACTPAAGLVPGGAMMGFDFEGEAERRGRSTAVKGWGFTEYGDFTGKLLGLTK